MTIDLRSLVLDGIVEAADFDFDSDHDVELYQTMRRDYIHMLGQPDGSPEFHQAAEAFDSLLGAYMTTDLVVALAWLEEFLLFEAVAWG
jgi:hypothetical protein